MPILSRRRLFDFEPKALRPVEIISAPAAVFPLPRRFDGQRDDGLDQGAAEGVRDETLAEEGGGQALAEVFAHK